MPDEPTYRELFKSIMYYGEFDRVPVLHWCGWPETRQEWIEQGLPEDVSEGDYFGVYPVPPAVGVNLELMPPFEMEILEETDEYTIARDSDGVVKQDWKQRSCIPRFIDFTLKDRAGWQDYKWRLQPDPSRLSKDLDQRAEELKAMNMPVRIHTGSMIGWTRDWMGVENLAYASYDDPGLIGEIADTVADLVCWLIDQVAPKIQIDMGWAWEDICFRSGPLVSPHIFKEHCVPAYRKVSDKLLQYGCDLHAVDCDGMIDDLVPLWLEGGVNVMFPVEIGVWKADPMAFRQEYGRELRIIGGIDKKEIPNGPEAIDAEIQRRVPLMKDGGYIPLPDHLIIPGTSLENYKYYLRRLGELRL